MIRPFFIDTFCVEVSIPGFPKKSTLFVSEKIDTFCVDFRNEENIKICLIEFIKSTRKSNLNYRFPLRKSYFRVQNHQHFRLQPPMTPAPITQIFACGAGENITFLWGILIGSWKVSFFIDTFCVEKKCRFWIWKSTLFVSILKSPKKRSGRKGN